MNDRRFTHSVSRMRSVLQAVALLLLLLRCRRRRRLSSKTSVSFIRPAADTQAARMNRIEMKIFLLFFLRALPPSSYRHLRRDITRPSVCSRVVDVTLNVTLLIAYASELPSEDECRPTESLLIFIENNSQRLHTHGIRRRRRWLRWLWPVHASVGRRMFVAVLVRFKFEGELKKELERIERGVER